jgi:hypothetical protein
MCAKTSHCVVVIVVVVAVFFCWTLYKTKLYRYSITMLVQSSY